MQAKTKIQSNVAQELAKAAAVPHAIMQQTYDYFVSQTPKDSGNARASTRLIKNTIEANYAYASELDAGSSKQSPKGMTTPALKKMQSLLDIEVKKIK
jgi:hypothetical protein